MKDYANIDERAWLLINGQIDGELSDSEQQELDALLANSKELQVILEELTGLSDCLQQLPEKTPPAYLHNAITSTVRLPVGESASGKKHAFTSWLTEHWLGPAFALTAGIMLTVGIYETNPDSMSGPDTTNMTGTMVNAETARGELLDRVQVGDDHVFGTAQLHRSGRDFLIDVNLDSKQPAKFTLNYAANGLEFIGVTSSENRVDGVIVDKQRVIIEGNGQQQYTLRLRSPDDNLAANSGPLKVGLSVNNGLLYQAELKVVKE